MADLRSVIYGDKTFTIPSGGEYEARIAALETSVAALQTQLEGYSAVLLQLNGDGSNRTAYDVLGKVHDLRPLNMFEAREGAYDVNGNWLGDLTKVRYEDWDTTDYMYYHGDGAGEGDDVQAVVVDRILAAYPTAKGIVLTEVGTFSEGAFKNAQSGDLDWISIRTGYGANYPDLSSLANLFDGGVTDAVGTIFIRNSAGAPWGQTNATINTTGTPVPWTE